MIISHSTQAQEIHYKHQIKDSVLISLKDIKLTNQIFVEHEYQAKVIEFQSELIVTQEQINSILLTSNNNLNSRLNNSNMLLSEHKSDFKLKLKEEKKKNTYTKIILIASLTLNAILILN